MASGLCEKHPGVSPGLALEFLCSGEKADRAGAGDGGQIGRLRTWCQAQGLRVPKSALELRLVGAGAEHEVYFDEQGQRAWKVTHDYRFGHGLKEEGVLATPMDYLERLQWQNELFGDDIIFHGLLESSAGSRLVSSQSWVTGMPGRPVATQEMIDAFLADFGFARSTRYPDGYIYYSSAMNLVIGDAQPSNVLLDENGVLRPIDLVIAKPSSKFALQLMFARI